MNAKTPLVALLAFGAGVAVGVFALGGRPERPAADSVAPALEDPPTRASVPDPAGVAPGHAEPAPGPRPVTDAAAAPPQAPTLAAPLADPARRLRFLVAEAARKELRSDLPADYLEEAVRLARGSQDYMPVAYARQFVWRERARRILGVLTDPWEIVVQIRTAGHVAFGLSEVLAVRPRFTSAAAPLDIAHPPVANPRPEPDSAYWKSGVPPIGMAVVLEEAVIEGAFGRPDGGSGEVQVEFGGLSLPQVHAAGTTKARLAGVHPEWSWNGCENSQLRVVVRTAAVEVRLKGRLLPRDSTERPVERPFRFLEFGSDGLMTGGPVVLQVIVGHGSGNRATLSLDRTKDDRIDGMAPRPIWDDGLDLKSERRSTAYSSGAGWVPAGKVFRVRRIDWRVRLAEPWGGSKFAVRVGHREVVEVPPNSRTVEEARAAREAARAKEREYRDRRQRGETIPAEYASGSWTGDAVIRPGEEGQASVSCASYAMGEAVLIGDLVDDDAAK